MTRREELTEGALDYVLAHGLIGLSLRPLAAALGTSDRMLIYHFGSKDRLITEIVALANRRISITLSDTDVPIDDVAGLVRYAWSMLNTPEAATATRLYLELCVLSVRDPGRWAGAQHQLRDPWLTLLKTALAELAVPTDRIAVLADLLLDGIDGLLLHRQTSTDPAAADAAAAAFADLMSQPV
jgi:AcrR family transcriptional regulator